MADFWKYSLLSLSAMQIYKETVSDLQLVLSMLGLHGTIWSLGKITGSCDGLLWIIPYLGERMMRLMAHQCCVWVEYYTNYKCYRADKTGQMIHSNDTTLMIQERERKCKQVPNLHSAQETIGCYHYLQSLS